MSAAQFLSILNSEIVLNSMQLLTSCSRFKARAKISRFLTEGKKDDNHVIREYGACLREESRKYVKRKSPKQRYTMITPEE